LSFRRPDRSLSEIDLLVLGLKGRSPCRVGYTLFFMPPSFFAQPHQEGKLSFDPLLAVARRIVTRAEAGHRSQVLISTWLRPRNGRGSKAAAKALSLRRPKRQSVGTRRSGNYPSTAILVLFRLPVVSVGLHVQQPQKPSQFLPLLPPERYSTEPVSQKYTQERADECRPGLLLYAAYRV
jgi:hypothetical protein